MSANGFVSPLSDFNLLILPKSLVVTLSGACLVPVRKVPPCSAPLRLQPGAGPWRFPTDRGKRVGFVASTLRFPLSKRRRGPAGQQKMTTTQSEIKYNKM